MITIEQEAEEYAWKKKNPFSQSVKGNELVDSSKIDFIAGYNSKATQAKVLQAQINLCKCILGQSNIDETSNYVEVILIHLEYQLKELE